MNAILMVLALAVPQEEPAPVPEVGLRFWPLQPSALPDPAWPGEEQQVPPKLERQEQPGGPAVKEEFIGVDAFAVYTRFDEGLKIEPRTGIGMDVWVMSEVSDIKGGIRLGYAGWNTENESGEGVPDEGVWVRQYRFGVGAHFRLHEYLDMSAWTINGIYRFRRDPDGGSEKANDSSPYTEIMTSIGYKPLPNLRATVFGMSTHTQSSFNHKNTHFHHNYSIGVSVEVRF